jgi:hypothetical protein
MLSIKDVSRVFLKNYYSFFEKIGKIQSSHYETESTDPLGTVLLSLGIHGV